MKRLLALAALAVGFSGCAHTLGDPQSIAALAPGGTLRVGLYPGSPTSYLLTANDGEPRGVGYELGKRLAAEARVRFQPVVEPSNEKVHEAVKAGRVDLVFTNATEARRAYLDFTPPVLQLEKGYLVPPGSRISSLADIDARGVRIGISRGSTTGAELAPLIHRAEIVPMPSLAAGREALADGSIDAYASNKAILSEMGDALPGSRVLPGRWGEENFAFGIPRGRAAAMPYLNAFAARVKRDGDVRHAAEAAGLRGLLTEPGS
jgi:polar amino acid transport system substrate-binding protein